MVRSLLLAAMAPICMAQTWTAQHSGSAASLRGVSAVSERVAWASGANGTCLRTTDGGASWRAIQVFGGGQLDFRGVHALDADTAWLLSSGAGDKSKIYKTSDGGGHWTLQYTNPDAKGFFDAIAFWDALHGITLGDPVDGQFVIVTTGNGGATWKRRLGVAALPGAGAFAASNSCLFALGRLNAWFGTGGGAAALVFRSSDGGRTWISGATPILGGAAKSGIFSIAFSDDRHGIAVGGDYAHPAVSGANIGITADGGNSWRAPSGEAPHGYRSSVVYSAARKAWIATGITGTDVSVDNGENWKQFDGGAYNALSAAGDAVWAVGPNGGIARLSWR